MSASSDSEQRTGSMDRGGAVGPADADDPGQHARARLERVLGSPELAWLVERIRVRLVRGQSLDTSVSLPRATPEQRRAVARLLGRAPGRGASVSVRLPDVERALRDAGIAPDLRSAVESLTAPVQTRASVRARRAAARASALRAASATRHAKASWHAEWLAEIERDGTLTRLLRRDQGHLLEQAAAVLDLLPEALPPAPGDAGDAVDLPSIPLPTLAEQATGDTKSLAGTTLGGLVLRALALRAGLPRPASAAERVRLWESAGVISNDLSSQVLVLHLRVSTLPEAHTHASTPPLHDWLNAAAEGSIPFRITLHQLTTMPVAPAAQDLYVCENPAVLRACILPRTAPPGPLPAPLVCTEGQPSLACHCLLRAARAAGARIHWHNDFDWDGLRMTATAVSRYGAEPWRMAAADYRTALATGDAEPLKGSAAPSPWDPRLATEMAASGRAIMEERLTPLLLADLGAPR